MSGRKHALLVTILIVAIVFSATGVFAKSKTKNLKLNTKQEKQIAADLCAMRNETKLKHKKKSHKKVTIDLSNAERYPAMYMDSGYGKYGGDYYRALFKSCHGTIRYKKTGKKKCEYKTKLEWMYRTTPAQEKELSKAVSEVIERYKLESELIPVWTKIVIIDKYVVQQVEYSKNDLGGYAQTAYGAMFRGKAVCEGYASLFYRLCRESGVPCRIVYGKSQKMNHAWNIVKIGDLWYNGDPTWNDVKLIASADYLLEGSNTFNKDHKAESMYTSSDFTKKFPISKTSYSNVMIEAAKGWILEQKNKL